MVSIWFAKIGFHVIYDCSDFIRASGSGFGLQCERSLKLVWLHSAATVLLRICCMLTQTLPSSNPNSQIWILDINSVECWDKSTIIIVFLSFTAAVDQPKPPKPTESPQPESPQPESRGRMGLYVGLTVFAVCVGLCFAFRLCFQRCKQHPSGLRETLREPLPEHLNPCQKVTVKGSTLTTDQRRHFRRRNARRCQCV